MQIRALFGSALLALSALAPAIASAPMSAIVIAVAPAMFDSEAATQAHCPRDVVVWLNIPSGVYHEKGMRWYGRTRHGAYVCKNARAPPPQGGTSSIFGMLVLPS